MTVSMIPSSMQQMRGAVQGDRVRHEPDAVLPQPDAVSNMAQFHHKPRHPRPEPHAPWSHGRFFGAVAAAAAEAPSDAAKSGGDACLCHVCRRFCSCHSMTATRKSCSGAAESILARESTASGFGDSGPRRMPESSFPGFRVPGFKSDVISGKSRICLPEARICLRRGSWEARRGAWDWGGPGEALGRPRRTRIGRPPELPESPRIEFQWPALPCTNSSSIPGGRKGLLERFCCTQ